MYGDVVPERSAPENGSTRGHEQPDAASSSEPAAAAGEEDVHSIRAVKTLGTWLCLGHQTNCYSDLRQAWLKPLACHH